jgi:hypothetical protein
MQWSRIAFAFVLILALAPAVTLPPLNVSGQSYATVTAETTITGFYTYSSTTSYVTGTTSSYIGAFGPTSFELNVCGLGANVNIKFNAVGGHRYHIEWTTQSNLPLNLYITTNVQDMGDIGCNGAHTGPVFPSATVLYSEKGTTGSVDWMAPGTSQFIVALFNFNLEPVSATWSIQGFAETTVSYVSYATAPTTKLISLTLTNQQSTTTVSQIGLPFGNFGLLVAIAAVAVIGGLFVVAKKRKPSPAVSLTWPS